MFPVAVADLGFPLGRGRQPRGGTPIPLEGRRCPTRAPFGGNMRKRKNWEPPGSTNEQ